VRKLRKHGREACELVDDIANLGSGREREDENGIENSGSFGGLSAGTAELSQAVFAGAVGGFGNAQNTHT
jgi:hypothetical protein